MLNALAVTAVGLLAQAFFSARTLVQWILSERSRRVLSPSIFWIFSTCGSVLLALYGYLRQDFAIIAGQVISYYVYLWNMRIKHVPVPRVAMCALMLVPVAALIGAASNAHQFVSDFFGRDDLPLWLLAIGTFGQGLFTFRFVYQWWYSRRVGESELPPLFWWISVAGAMIVFGYGIMRADIVLLLSQGFGIFVYIRNLYIGYHPRTSSAKAGKTGE